MNAQTQAMFGSAINWSTGRDLYPDAGGPTTASIGSAQTPYTTDAAAAGPGADVSNAGAGGSAPAAANVGSGLFGKPVTWFAALVVLFLVLGFVGHKLGGREGEVGVHNLKLSGYNVAFITIAAILGITAAKVIFTRFTVPGLSAVVQAT